MYMPYQLLLFMYLMLLIILYLYNLVTLNNHYLQLYFLKKMINFIIFY